MDCYSEPYTEIMFIKSELYDTYLDKYVSKIYFVKLTSIIINVIKMASWNLKILEPFIFIYLFFYFTTLFKYNCLSHYR